MGVIEILAGAIVGLSLGMTGGGGAIFAVPLLVYLIGESPQSAIGISLVTVSSAAAVGFIQRWQLKQVEMKPGLIFAVGGLVGSPIGTYLASYLSDLALLISFACLMFLVAYRMWKKASQPQKLLPLLDTDQDKKATCYRDPAGVLRLNSRCAMLLTLVGLGVGALSGMFGVGGGFIIVPALVQFSGMGIRRAIGTSLFVIAAVGLSALLSRLAAGATALPLATTVLFLIGSIAGLFIGTKLGQLLSGPRLQQTFAVAIALVAIFVIVRNVTWGA